MDQTDASTAPRQTDTSTAPNQTTGTLPREGSLTVVSVNVSARKGEKKQPAGSATLIAGHGIEGDAHAGPWIRQVSLLGEEDIAQMRGRGVEIRPGDFAENLTVEGLRLASLPVGTRITLGEAVLEVSKIGKECHYGCAIRQAVGDCVMPRSGIFALVVKGGIVRDGDTGLYRL